MTPAGWAHYASGGAWRLAPHLSLLNRKLVDVAAGRLPRLIIEMPPRHGKSEFTSHYFPGWFLGTYPDRRVILTSYEASFAATWGQKARDTFREYGPEVFGHRVSDSASARAAWSVQGHPGGMITAGVGGGITGRGANLLIIDDPVKNAEEANSETTRQSAWDWYLSTVRTRIEPGGAMILIMTRWHLDDLAGRLLAEIQQGGEPWELLRLPAVAQEDEQILNFKRASGEALWPARYSTASLAALRRTLTAYWWEALYQQNPLQPGGMVFRREWFPIVKEIPRGMRMVRYWDRAASTKASADYTVGLLAGEQDGRYYVADVIRGQWSPLQCEQLIAQTAILDRQEYGSVQIYMEQEGGSSGKDTIDHYQRDVLKGFPFHPDPVSVSKEQRADVAAAAAEAGNILLREADWVKPFLDELETFPAGAHDDQADTLSGAVKALAKRIVPIIGAGGSTSRSTWDRGGE